MTDNIATAPLGGISTQWPRNDLGCRARMRRPAGVEVRPAREEGAGPVSEHDKGLTCLPPRVHPDVAGDVARAALDLLDAEGRLCEPGDWMAAHRQVCAERNALRAEAAQWRERLDGQAWEDVQRAAFVAGAGWAWDGWSKQEDAEAEALRRWPA